jgi:hypothetical protein
MHAVQALSLRCPHKRTAADPNSGVSEVTEDEHVRLEGKILIQESAGAIEDVQDAHTE